jgi:tRNA-Thr(GGU) m(6)t(6)A37 methyltransferase TsaA
MTETTESGERPDRRASERAVPMSAPSDAALVFVGRIRTPWTRRADCPRQGDALAGPVCRIEVDPPWDAALEGLAGRERLQVLYWMHEARRDLVLQRPHGSATPTGTFGLRSPVRPNPIASSEVALVGLAPGMLLVRGLDCLDGTPLLDIKPVRCAHG